MNTDPVTPRDIVPSIPEELERICLKAMNSNIDERYQTASEMLADLEQYKAQSLAAHVLEDSDVYKRQEHSVLNAPMAAELYRYGRKRKLNARL